MAKLCYYVVLGLKIPTTKHEIMLHATPLNLPTYVYARVGTAKTQVAATHLLCTRSTFSRSLMVSVGVSALRTNSTHFVEPGVKVNGCYYQEVLLMLKLLPDIHQLSEFNKTVCPPTVLARQC